MISDNTVLDRLVEKCHGKQTALQARLHLPHAQTINWWRKRGIAWGARVRVHALAVELGVAVPEGWIMTPPKGSAAARTGRLGRPRKTKPKPKRVARSKPKRRPRNGGLAHRAPAVL